MGEVETVQNIEKLSVDIKFPCGNVTLPEKAIRRLIPWLSVGTVVQVSNGSNVDSLNLPDNVV